MMTKQEKVASMGKWGLGDIGFRAWGGGEGVKAGSGR